MGKNKISKIENLENLTTLTCLSLQSNRLTQLENLSALVKLDELYLSENGITKIENLDANVLLQTLDLAQNMIKTVENIKHLQHLEEFWVRIHSFIFNFVIFIYNFFKLNDNQVSEWSNIDEELKENKKLSTIYLERNPIANDPTYRRKLKLLIPSLSQIDATLCG